MTEAFNPNEHMKQLKGKDYLEVKWRLVWFQQATGSRAGYVTYELEHDRQNGYARYGCVAWDGSDAEWREIILGGKGVTVSVCGRMATGTKSETRADFADFAEKAETGAIGRALAGLGFGTQFAPDVEEGARIVDTPVQRQQPPQRPATPPQQQPALMQAPEPDRKLPDQGAPPNDQQLLSIHKLCVALGREEPAADAGLTFVTASDLIRRLSRDYNNQRRGKSA